MRRFKFLSLNVLAFLLLLGLLDIFLQTSGISLPAFVVHHERFGRLFKPGAGLLMLNEGFHMGKVNNYAYLGPAYPQEKPQGVTRVALLGDSFVEGFQVFDRHHMRNQMEQTLNSAEGTAIWQVQNFGFSGFNLARMYFYHREFVRQFSPDISLFFVSDEDFWTPDESGGPGFSMLHDSLAVDFSKCLPEEGSLQMRLAVLRNMGLHSLLQKSRRLLQQGKLPVILFDKLAKVSEKASDNPDPGRAIALEQNPRVAINRELLRLMMRYNQQDGDIIFVAREPLSSINSGLLSEYGLTVWNLQKSLDKLQQQGVNPRFWKATNIYGHWNHAAHAAIGHFLGEQIAAAKQGKLQAGNGHHYSHTEP